QSALAQRCERLAVEVAALKPVDQHSRESFQQQSQCFPLKKTITLNRPTSGLMSRRDVRSGGIADDQVAPERLEIGLVALAAAAEERRNPLGDLDIVAADSGQRRSHVSAHFEIAEADDRHIIGYGEATVAQRRDGAIGKLVARRLDRAEAEPALDG